jgi:catechol 2,3-dioxygenase-like lactoylglutathione lyase family enzyme
MSLANARPVSFVSARDRAAARAFYENVLGLPHKSGDDFGDFHEMGDGLLRITPMPDFEPHAHPVVGWDVADITAAVRALRAKGVQFSIYDGLGQDADGVWTAPGGDAKVAWFADPSGNVLSLSQT